MALNSDNPFRKLITDRHGKVVLNQRPNLPLIVWIVTLVLLHLVPGGTFKDFLQLLNFGALFTWAWLEIFDGTTPLRRIMGSVVMVFLFINRL